MDGFFTDWAGDDDRFDEDEFQVNRNDPFGEERRHFSPYEDCELPHDYDQEEVEALSYQDDDNDIDFEEEVDDPDIIGIIPAAGVLGGMISEEIADQHNPSPTKVSLPQYTQDLAPKSQKKVHLRPFEQWVQDVLNGKRDINDI